MSTFAIESLMKERQKIKTEQLAANATFALRISELENAIEHISGKKVWEVEKEIVYDDENPDYIKGSIED
jgi:hypothetical protein